MGSIIEMINKSKRVVLVKTNLVDIDPRLIKEMKSLLKGGYDITLISWDRECKSKIRDKNPKEYKDLIFRLKAPTGPKILPLLPLWWCFVFTQLFVSTWDVVHIINMDSIIPASLIAKLKRKPIIYEMHDTYEDHIVLPKPVRSFALRIDKLFMKLSNAVIIVDESRIQELNGIPNKNVIVIYNAPEDTKFKSITHRKPFLIFYAGYLARNRSIEKVLAAVKDLEDVDITIAGFGELVPEIKSFTSNFPDKITFVGKIPYSEVLERTSSADLLFSLYDPRIPLNRYASSNKLFEAMMCNKPIIVSKGTSMDKIVEQEICGLVVDCQNVDMIKYAIIQLKNNPELCIQLGNNGRRAFEKKYSWNIMEKKLFDLYKAVCSKNK
jgi:glycosyltransferase involved in cell wall biosynthesis